MSDSSDGIDIECSYDSSSDKQTFDIDDDDPLKYVSSSHRTTDVYDDDHETTLDQDVSFDQNQSHDDVIVNTDDNYDNDHNDHNEGLDYPPTKPSDDDIQFFDTEPSDETYTTTTAATFLEAEPFNSDIMHLLDDRLGSYDNSTMGGICEVVWDGMHDYPIYSDRG